MKKYRQLYMEKYGYKLEQSEQIDDHFPAYNKVDFIEKSIEYVKSINATSYWFHFILKYYISAWTMGADEVANRDFFIKEFPEALVPKKTIRENSEYHIPEAILETSVGQTIKVMRLSEFRPSIKEIIPNIEKKSREGDCFYSSYTIAENLITDCNIVTGFIYGMTSKSEYLHSWIETIIDNEEVVMDATLNIVMNKKGYYFLMHANPITIINNKTFLEDFYHYPILCSNKNIPLEIYYLFRDEIISELQEINSLQYQFCTS